MKSSIRAFNKMPTPWEKKFLLIGLKYEARKVLV